MAAALQVEPATTTDVDEAGEVPAGRGGGDAAGVADWARAVIGSASIRTINTMTGVRRIAYLLWCRHPLGDDAVSVATHGVGSCPSKTAFQMG